MKKKKKNETEDLAISEKKQKSKKSKTDPNLFLFNDVVDNSSAQNDNIDIEEISTISDESQDSFSEEDMDTPSYLRKGTGQ